MRPRLRRPGSFLVALLVVLALGALVGAYALVSEGAGSKQVAVVAQYEPAPSTNPPDTTQRDDKCKKAKRKFKRAKHKFKRAKHKFKRAKRKKQRADTAGEKSRATKKLSRAEKKLKQAKKKKKRAKKRKRKACRR